MFFNHCGSFGGNLSMCVQLQHTNHVNLNKIVEVAVGFRRIHTDLQTP